MGLSVSVTVVQKYPAGNTTQGQIGQNGPPLFIQALPVDSAGNASGAEVDFSSSNTNVAQMTSPSQIGNAPVGIKGIGSGTATITATCKDATTVTATFAVTVL